MQLDISVILPSAITAAAVSSVFLLIGQWLERRSRTQELLFKTAIEMAREKRRVLSEQVNNSGIPLVLIDDITASESYYHDLKHLFDHGKLPKDHHDEVNKQLRDIGITQD
jgi:hypothetical protein